MADKKICVLGAGLSGLSAAWHLQRRGFDCRVFEKEKEVGGLCRSKVINGFTFDYDGHLLHFKHAYTFNLIKKLLAGNLTEHRRSAWFYSHGIFSRYPFQANLHGLPADIVKECLLGFINASKNIQTVNKKNLTFLEWIKKTFGSGIARHFMIPYNTKFWTLPPECMTCEWLDNFIPVPSLSQLVEGIVKESRKQFGYNARFWYPRQGGISEVPLAFAGQVKNIYTASSITEIDLIRKEIKINSGAKEKFDYLISTIPLPQMRYLIRGLPSNIAASLKKLKWNSVFNLNLGIGRKDTSGRHWIYFPQKENCFFRIGFPHNFSSCLVPPDKSSLYVEVAYSKDKPIDKNRIILQIKADLRKIGILSSGDKICAQDINDIKYGYPIYDANYNKARSQILVYLNHNNIIPCGRYGSWRYLSMEDVILESGEIANFVSKDV